MTEPITWPAARPIIQEEIDRLGMTPYTLAVKADLPLQTVYNALNPASQKIYVETLGSMLRAIGRGWPWLIKQLPPVPPAKESPPCKATKPPKKAATR